MSRAIFQVTPTQVVSFFGYGFEPTRVFNPYQVYELYYSSLEPKAVTPAHVRLEDEALHQGFMDYLISNDYGRYVEPEEFEASEIPPALFFHWFFIPRGEDMRDLFLHLAKYPEIHLSQLQAEQVASAYVSNYFVDGNVDRDLYFQGFLPQKATTQGDTLKIINTVNRDRRMKEVAVSIEASGYALHVVGAGEGDPHFIYTQGLVDKAGYELLVAASIPTEVLQVVITELVTRSLETPLELGIVETSLTFQSDEVVRIKLIEASSENLYQKFVCQRSVEAPRVLQILVADMHNVLPGEPGYDITTNQPILVG